MNLDEKKRAAYGAGDVAITTFDKRGRARRRTVPVVSAPLKKHSYGRNTDGKAKNLPNNNDLFRSE